MRTGHLGDLKYVFGLSGILTFYGFVSFVIYMLPPDAQGQHTYKIVMVAMILITLPFALIGGFVASRRAKKRERLEQEAAAAAAGEAAPAEAQAQREAAPVAGFDDITKSTEETVQFLKTSNLGVNGRDAVYSLPWYMVAGTPRAGKSSLVLGSNLNFQNLPSQRPSELKFLRPTGSVDWRVTSDAVFIDTAGRYQTEGIDAEEWASLLETVKKYRSNRPLDGFLLVVDAEKILKSDERQVEEMAKVLRARLDDAIQRLKVRFPVYLVFTHADAIEGFRDSFSTSKNEDKTLVWGATIPLEKSENAQALFDGEYEVLQNSIMKRRLLRLSAPFPPVRQLRIFNFPLHFGSARRKFAAFVNALFRPNPFSENPFLRGFYFTAAPTGKASPNAPQMPGSSYFTERFFRDVVLRDKDLVRTFLAQRQRPPIFGWLLTMLGVVIVAALLGLAGISLFKNKQLLDQAETQGQKVLTVVKSDAGKNPLDKNERDTRNELNATDDLRQLLVTLDENERNGAPYLMRFGLYSGNGVYRNNLLPLYFTVVEKRFKEPALRKIEADLAKFASGQGAANPGKPTPQEEQVLANHYDLLKAYLMLSGDYAERADATHIANTLKPYWAADSKIPPDMKLVADQQLEFWAKQVDRPKFDGDYKFPRIALNGKLIKDVRTKLRAFPPEQRHYRRIVTEISKQVDDTNGPTSVQEILSRNNADARFVTGTSRVPGAYTRPGHDLMKEAIAKIDLSEDDWVMGEEGRNELNKSTDSTKILEIYYRDYAERWRDFVKNISVRAYKDKQDAADAMQVFSSAGSPAKIIAAEIAKHTNLSAKAEAEGWIDWLISYVWTTNQSENPGTDPEIAFRPLFTFVGTKDKQNAPVEKYVGEMGRAYNAINRISAERWNKIAQELADDNDNTLKLRDREAGVESTLAGFNDTPAAQDVANFLQQPLSNLRILLGAGEEQQLAKTWSEQIVPDAKAVERGFPFDDSGTDSDLTNLTKFLNPADGRFSKFYSDRLSKYFEESGGQLRLKDTAKDKFSPEFVLYVNNAINLRKALFGTSPTPKFGYEFKIMPGANSLVDITIDGQKVTSEGTGSYNGTFPATGSAETGVLLNFASTASPATTGGAPTGSESTSGTSTGSDACSKKFSGNWGLFRFVEAGQPQKQPGGEYALTYSLCGKTLRATIKPSGGDLFDKSIFRQLRAPQNLK